MSGKLFTFSILAIIIIVAQIVEWTAVRLISREVDRAPIFEEWLPTPEQQDRWIPIEETLVTI